LHGRLSGKDKDDVMSRFARGEIDVLVANDRESRWASTFECKRE